MQILMCIDDTDNLDSSGTGELASIIANTIEERGWGKTNRITRHQLLIHPDVPYTSHNSSMCFRAEIKEEYLNCIKDYASDFLIDKRADGSDPGLCIAVLEMIKEPERLIAFGQKAKKEIVTKQQAYQLAQQLGVHLSEHGGTGEGVIGALAGVGLRLSGNDGRFRGKLKIGTANGLISVSDLCSRPEIDVVKSLEGIVLDKNELIQLGDWVKVVLYEGQSVLFVTSLDNQINENVKWQTCSKQQLRDF